MGVIERMKDARFVGNNIGPRVFVVDGKPLKSILRKPRASAVVNMHNGDVYDDFAAGNKDIGSDQPNVTCSEKNNLSSMESDLNIPCGLNEVNVAATFGVPLTSPKDLDDITKDIEARKYAVILTGMNSDNRKAVMDALFAMWG
ncbi:hypothetical protein Tco_0198826 [Tanacetum coccineum]